MLFGVAISSAPLVAALLLADPATPIAVGPIDDELRKAFDLDPFYAQHAMAGGVPVVGSPNVRPQAIAEAAHLIGQMLADRPEMLAVLASRRGRVCVIAATEFSSQMPEFADQRPAAVYYDRRGRGYGNAIACSIGEENLLHFRGDPYPTECILIHEFAHLLDAAAFPQTVDGFDARLQAAYDAAIADGLWDGTYAATNPAEFFAELTQSWFDTNRQNDRLHNHVDTRDELRAYDPRGAALMAACYGDGAWRYSRADTRAAMPHLASWDFAGSPRFAWPKALQARYDALSQSTAEAAALLAEAGVNTVALADEPIVSSDGGATAGLIIVNATDGPIAADWVRNDGVAKPYGRIPAGAISAKSTYAGHVWRLSTVNGQPLGRVRTPPGSSRVVVE